MFYSLSPAASLMDFKTYFAIEALFNDHRERERGCSHTALTAKLLTRFHFTLNA